MQARDYLKDYLDWKSKKEVKAGLLRWSLFHCDESSE